MNNVVNIGPITLNIHSSKIRRLCACIICCPRRVRQPRAVGIVNIEKGSHAVMCRFDKCLSLLLSSWLVGKLTFCVCVLDIQRWSNSHECQLNAAESELIRIGTRRQLAKLSQASLTMSIGDSDLPPSAVVRNLSVYIDEHISMDANARQRWIRKLCRYVDTLGWWRWLSGRTSVFGRRTFPVLRPTCSWRVTTHVGKPSAAGQPTRLLVVYVFTPGHLLC